MYAQILPVVIVIVVILVVLYSRKFKKPGLEKLNLLKQRFDYGKSLNLLTIDEINQYAKLNNCADKQFMQGVTFSTAVILLQEIELTVFSAKNSIGFFNSKQSPVQLEENLQKVELHIQHIADVRAIFDHYFKHKKLAD